MTYCFGRAQRPSPTIYMQSLPDERKSPVRRISPTPTIVIFLCFYLTTAYGGASPDYKQGKVDFAWQKTDEVDNIRVVKDADPYDFNIDISASLICLPCVKGGGPR